MTLIMKVHSLWGLYLVEKGSKETDCFARVLWRETVFLWIKIRHSIRFSKVTSNELTFN